MPKVRCVAILEVMWDWEEQTSTAGYKRKAPKWFNINPNNLTGSRLYKFLGHNSLLVTNACPDLVYSAKGKGTPSPKWLRENLKQLEFDLLLVCGSVAKKTLQKSRFKTSARIVEIPHPAARVWTKEKLEEIKNLIQSGVC